MINLKRVELERTQSYGIYNRWKDVDCNSKFVGYQVDGIRYYLEVRGFREVQAGLFQSSEEISCKAKTTRTSLFIQKLISEETVTKENFWETNDSSEALNGCRLRQALYFSKRWMTSELFSTKIVNLNKNIISVKKRRCNKSFCKIHV